MLVQSPGLYAYEDGGWALKGKMLALGTFQRRGLSMSVGISDSIRTAVGYNGRGK